MLSIELYFRKAAVGSLDGTTLGANVGLDVGLNDGTPVG